MGLRLSLSPGGSRQPRPSVPTAVIITDDTIKASTAGLVGTLLMVGGIEPAVFSILGAGGAFSIDGSDLVADGSQSVGDYPLTIRATDARLRSLDEVVTVQVAAEEGAGDGGLGDTDGGIVAPPEVFDVPPITQDTSNGLKIAGKNGGSAVFLFDIGAPEPGGVYSMRYDPDWSGMSKQGRHAAVGFALKAGDDFHLVGPRGNGANPATMVASRVYGDFARASQFTLSNDGPVNHGSKDGPNWLQLEIDQFGETYTLRTSADGEVWADEYTDEMPLPLGAATDALQFGPGAYFANQDKGVFTIVFAFFALLGAENRYTDNIGSSTPLVGINAPVAFYDAAGDTTWLSYEGWNGTNREAVVTSYDHAAGRYGDAIAAGPNPLIDDNHGTPAIEIDDEGHLHAFYGSHNTVQLHSSTRWPVTGPEGDGSLWSIRGQISAGLYTYPRITHIDGVLYAFLRKTVAGVTRWLVLLKTSALAAGVATWVAEKEIVDFGAGTRFYGTRVIRVGTELHFIGTKADDIDTARLHLYYFIYDTADGSLSNYDKSTSVAAGSLPIDLATADGSFRIVESTGSNRTDIPAFEIDALGRMHIAYADGEGLTFDIKHITLSGGSWSEPVTIGEITGVSGEGFIDEMAFTQMPGDGVALYWPHDPGGDWDVGGDMVRRIRSSAGVWGDLQTVMPAGARALARPVTVRDGHADARLMFSEILQSQEDDGAGGLRIYVFGDSGLLQRAEFDDAPQASGDLHLDADPLTLGADPLTIETAD